MTVYILEPDDHVFSLNRLTARIGFLALGQEIVMFDDASFETFNFQQDDIVQEWSTTIALPVCSSWFSEYQSRVV